MKIIDTLAHIVVYGGIALFLWIIGGALIGAAWAAATVVHGWLT